MSDCLRQLWLLTRKNLILTRRSKVWTLFELIMPILIMLPIVMLVAKGGTTTLNAGASFGAVPLEGTAADVARQTSVSRRVGKVRRVPSIRTRWCNQERVSLAYFARDGPDTVEKLMNTDGQDAVDKLMNTVAQRFSGSVMTLDVVKMNDESSMLEQLRADAPNRTVFVCDIMSYAGGVIFEKFDPNAAQLNYRILIPTGFKEDEWYLSEEWSDPFGANLDFNTIPLKPPYWSSAFLSLQYAIDSLFIEASSPDAAFSQEPAPNTMLPQELAPNATLQPELPSNATLAQELASNATLAQELYLRRIPEPSYIVNSVAIFLRISSYIWGVCVFVLVIHTAREVTSERSSVKIEACTTRLSCYFVCNLYMSYFDGRLRTPTFRLVC